MSFLEGKEQMVDSNNCKEKELWVKLSLESLQIPLSNAITKPSTSGIIIFI